VITVNEVRRAVIQSLDSRFPEMRIYGEEIKQGLQEPCFFVQLFPVSQERELGRRYKRYHAFDIHYFPSVPTPGEPESANDEMHAMAEQLYDVLEYITVSGSLLRGTGMNHEMINGILHFFVDYNIHLMRPRPDSPVMRALDQEARINERATTGSK